MSGAFSSKEESNDSGLGNNEHYVCWKRVNDMHRGSG